MKICILGCAESWNTAPFDDTDVEIWTLNGALINSVPRFNRHFDVHIPYLNYHQGIPNYSKWLHENESKLWILDKSDEFSIANVIDKNRLLAKHNRYFTSTIAWLMAVAIECPGVTDIYLCGVDLAQEQEYREQRPCVEYFIGYARALGIKVHLQQTTTLLKSNNIYGII